MEKEGGAVIGGGGQWPKMEKRLVQMGNPPPPPSRPREDLGGGVVRGQHPLLGGAPLPQGPGKFLEGPEPGSWPERKK